MDNGGVFFIIVIVFFFLLWAAGGGPSRSISFAGPYITPITNENETQSAYGPQLKVGGTVNLPSSSLTVGEKGSTQTTIQNPSSYTGLVTVSHVAGDATNPSGYAQISVSSTAGKSIDITNWILTSSTNKESGPVPTGILVLQLGAKSTLQDIVLKPGDKANVAAGISPAVSSFEANECSGYLTSQQSLYNSCVSAHVNDPGFLVGTWYVYLGRSVSLWNETGDTISLLDTSGKVVATASY